MSETQQQRFTLTDELQVMPPLSDEEYAALKADISQNGVEDPIVHDEGLVVIDGHHRVRACRELGVDMDTVPTKAVVGLSDDEKREKAYKLNLQRRHLEDGQKQDIVEQYLVNDWDGDNTGEWQNELANQLGVGDGTVYRAHRDLRDAGKLIHLDIFSKGAKEQQAKDYLDEHPDASNREVADAIEADVSHATVGNWRNEYDWDDDEDESGVEVTKDTPTIESFGRGVDADDRATQSEEIVDTATDEDAPDEAKEAAQEKAEEVNRGESTPDKAAAEVKQAGYRENTEPETETPELPDETYRTVVLDPPWDMDKIERTERPQQGTYLDYPTMDIDEIQDLPVDDLAADSGAHVYLWTTQKHLPTALECLESWGARYECTLTWVKPTGVAPFSWQYNTEHVLFARFGDGLQLDQQGLQLSFEAPVTEHSEKPDVFYERARQASPGPRLNMFARRQRDGFDVWGDEV